MPGRILIVDDVPTNRIILKAKLAQGYYEILDAEDGETGLQLARRERPDMILLDVMLPGIDGYEVCRRLKDDARTAHIPVIMITALNEASERIKGLEAGADDFLPKPINDLALFARVRTLMRMKMMIDELHLRYETTRDLGLVEVLPSMALDEPGRVLMAPPSTQDAAIWSRALGDTGAGAEPEVNLAFSEREVMTMTAPLPDVLVINQVLADGTEGLRLVSALRSRSDLRMASIIFVAASEEDVPVAATALDLGASDYITGPVDSLELAARVRSQLRRKIYSDRLRMNVIDGLKLAAIDPLTGLYNRRYAHQHMKKLLGRSDGDESGLALLMLDLDKFKRVNDKYGHAVGDAVLSEFAQRLRENVRGVDLVARLGGEEFCIGMPDITVEKAVEIAERVRNVMETQPFSIPDAGAEICVTVSVGVARASGGSGHLDHLIDCADKALYCAKNGGRNQVIIAAAAEAA